jgi:hypothetical protein
MTSGLGASRQLHLAVCRSTEDNATIIFETTVPAGSDVTIGATPAASLVVAEWSDAPFLLIAAGAMLHLSGGMRVNMCGDNGERRVVGTFEELRAAGVTMPIAIDGRRMSIRLRAGLSVFAKYLDDE